MLSVVNVKAKEEGIAPIIHYFYVRTMDLSKPKTLLNTFTNVFLQLLSIQKSTFTESSCFDQI